MPSVSSTLTRSDARQSTVRSLTALRFSVGGRRRTGMLAGSAVLVAVCSALFASAYLKASHQVPVLAVVRPVPLGSVVQASDLTVVHIAASGGLHPIRSSDAARVVGRRAGVGLVPGELLTMDQLSGASTVPQGSAVVGVAVKPSQLPAEGVVTGESVDVVLTGIPGSPVFASPGDGGALGSGATGTVPTGPDAATGSAAEAGTPTASAPTLVGTVLAPAVLVTDASPATSSNGGTADVSVVVPLNVAPVVASASAAGQLALVAVPAP